MAMLDDKEIEAEKLAAMLTTALQWLLSNIPETALPPALRPALLLMKSLVPYLGYIGGFVAWSWGAIKGFDVGFGVTLTATWLLPIALIPGTWQEKDVPQPAPPANPTPTPDPPAGDPSSPPPTDPTPPTTGNPPADPSPPNTGDPSVSPASPSPPSTGDPSAPPSSDPSPSPATPPPNPTNTTQASVS